MKNTSLFNLIKIFSRKEVPVLNTVDPVLHCEQNHHHDFYCDAERPHINN